MFPQVRDWRGAACPSHRFPPRGYAPTRGSCVQATVSPGASVSNFSSGAVRRMHRIPPAAITRSLQNRCVYPSLHSTQVHLGESHGHLPLLVLKVPLKGQAKPTGAGAGLKLLQKDLQGNESNTVMARGKKMLQFLVPSVLVKQKLVTVNSSERI